MKNIEKGRYIILEIIPTSVDPKHGDIAQISALKINNLKLEDRFDYRLDKKKIKTPDILNMINYDNDSFIYEKSTKKIKEKFKTFIGKSPLLIIDNLYTNNYLSDYKNSKYSIFEYLNLKLSDNVFDELIKKYNLVQSNYLVDLLYEALIMEYN